MSVREKGPRSAWSSPTRPFSRPVRRADRAETGVSTYAASPFTAEKDSLAERAGFEPSVPRGKSIFSRPARNPVTTSWPAGYHRVLTLNAMRPLWRTIAVNASVSTG